MVTARSWTRPSTKSWKSRSLRKSNEPERSEFRVPSSEFAKGSLPHDRGLSWRGKDHLRGQTRRKADEARAARRPDHERPGERTGRYSDVALARVRYGRNSGRLFLLPVQFARGRSEQADRRHASDVFIAEPVGSCTDLVATVTYPLRRIYGDNFFIASLSVLVDPIRAARIFGLEAGSKFSDKVLYIYRKQLEEADLIVVNKIDLLDTA